MFIFFYFYVSPDRTSHNFPSTFPSTFNGPFEEYTNYFLDGFIKIKLPKITSFESLIANVNLSNFSLIGSLEYHILYVFFSLILSITSFGLIKATLESSSLSQYQNAISYFKFFFSCFRSLSDWPRFKSSDVVPSIGIRDCIS